MGVTRRTRRVTAAALTAGILSVTAGVTQAHQIAVTSVVRGGEAPGERVGVTISKADRPDTPGQISRLRHGETNGPFGTGDGRRHRIQVTTPSRYALASLACLNVPKRGAPSPAGRAGSDGRLDITVAHRSDVRCAVVHDRRVAVRVTAHITGPGSTARAVAVSVAGSAPAALTDGGSAGPVDVTGRATVTVTAAGTPGTDLGAHATTLRCAGATVSPAGDGWRLRALWRAPADGVIDCTLTADRTLMPVDVTTRVVTDDGGTATPADVTIAGSVDGAPVPPFAGAQSPTRVMVPVGAAYRIDASAPAGYAVTASEGCASDAAATAAAMPCTITADDIAPRLTVVTRVVNDNGGTRSPADFAMSVAGPRATPAAFPGSDAGTAVTLAAGDYAVTQAPVAAYALTLDAGCAGTIAVGESRVCTALNDDIPATPEEPEQPDSPTAPGGEPVPAPTAVAPAPAGADAPHLQLATAGPRTVATPARVTQMIVVRNTGARRAGNVVVTARAPRGMRVAATSEGTVRNRTITAPLGSLAPGARRSVRVTLETERAARGRAVTSVSARAQLVATRRARIDMQVLAPTRRAQIK